MAVAKKSLISKSPSKKSSKKSSPKASAITAAKMATTTRLTRQMMGTTFKQF